MGSQRKKKVERSKRKGEELAMRKEEGHEMRPSSRHCEEILY
jgi:hypothetical protein